MRAKQITLAVILATAFVEGVISATQGDRNAQLVLEYGSALISLAPVFVWLRQDELQTGYRRSAFFNVGLVALAAVFIPLYFYRSRPSGARLRSVVLSIALMVLFYGVSLIGAISGVLITQQASG